MELVHVESTLIDQADTHLQIPPTQSRDGQLENVTSKAGPRESRPGGKRSAQFIQLTCSIMFFFIMVPKASLTNTIIGKQMVSKHL